MISPTTVDSSLAVEKIYHNTTPKQILHMTYLKKFVTFKNGPIFSV